jgi:transposase
MTDAALRRLSPRFEVLYASNGRPSVPPEQLLRALLLQVLYSIRSERLLMEQLKYNLLFRWFVGLGMDDAMWTPTTFTKKRFEQCAVDGEMLVREQALGSCLRHDVLEKRTGDVPVE